MLFSYSPSGYEENWLHEALIAVLGTDMDAIDVNGTPLAWPACLPPAKREELRGRRGLRERRSTFLDAYTNLTPVERAFVREAMTRQNEFPALFQDNLPCANLDEFPEGIRAPLKSLFEFAFTLLTDLGLRDRNYGHLYDSLDYKVCAFCGVEMLDAPGQKREALDHYLPVALYPFAGVNFRNLTPMGSKCNSRYKGRQDILRAADTGQRRQCCDPYASPILHLSLDESRPFEGDVIRYVVCPAWVVRWEGGDQVRLDTWETVFGISERYKASSLNPHFRDWLDHFSSWAARKFVPGGDREALRYLLNEFSEVVVPEGLADAAFLKRATFRMLAHHCDDSDGGERIFEWLHDLVSERQELAA